MATLTVTVKEDLVLNGASKGGEFTKIIENVNECYSRIVDLGTTADTEVLKFGSADGAGTILRSKLKYLRLTNLSTVSASSITLSFEDTDLEQYFISLDPGQSYTLFNTDFSANDETTSEAIGASPYTFSSDLDLIMARSDSGSPQLEVFAAMS